MFFFFKFQCLVENNKAFLWEHMFNYLIFRNFLQRLLIKAYSTDDEHSLLENTVVFLNVFFCFSALNKISNNNMCNYYFASFYKLKPYITVISYKH